jgi:hypothetical protein
MGKKRASEKPGGFEDDPERIMQELLPGPAPPPDDPATAIQSIGEWNDTWVSIVECEDTKRLVLSKELREFIALTEYLARWCESAELDSSPLIEYAHAAWDTYYTFRPTLPPSPDTVWVLLERLKYRLQPFTLRPIIEPRPAADEVRRKPIPKDEAEILVRDYLEKNPGATASQVAKGVGIAQGRLTGLASWRAEQGKRKANRVTAPKTIRRLTRKMLETIGRTNDPSARLEALDVAWEEMLAGAGPRERVKLLSMTKEEQSRLTEVRLEQASEDLDLWDGDS